MSDAFQVLKIDHEAITTVLRRLSAGPGGARQRLAERLIIEVTKHETVEEEFFWPAVREHVSGGGAPADEATAQEQHVKSALQELDGLSAGDPRFEEPLSGLIGEIRAHLTFEETRVWPPLRRALTGTQAAELGTALMKGKSLAPTHPDPGIAPEPGILKASGAMTAAADRLKDAATGRGRD
ncbi:hemerythrin domain-containing protein [Actinomadura sp. DC4]|uniref:hemerythrin domain-containing protein n=1 Tax=Actinomadura sp. DC4 TaxID=3055069 RepID=UPI0025B20B50|nr:hemerythrin domain-containing protein [Actinomadura sp. DC4]MDN3358753.1 hemerythrin domain-containing protein [Actinomadura sp. DC4]